jgi:hypothetical protein
VCVCVCVCELTYPQNAQEPGIRNLNLSKQCGTRVYVRESACVRVCVCMCA